MLKNLPCFLLVIGFLFSTHVLAQPELDTSFNGTGTISRGTSFTFHPADTAVQPDNKMISLSWCINISTQIYQFCFVRMNENASLDTTFDEGNPFSEPGTATIAIPESTRNAAGGGSGLVVLEDGKILAVGFATFSGVIKPVMIRLNSNGTMDSTFGTNGVLTYSTGRYFSKVTVQPDGKIVVAGYTDLDQLAARFLPDGTPDNTFGDNGFKILVNPAGNTVARSIALQADGKIVIGGSLGTTPVSYLLTRLNSDGSLDTAFDDDGYKAIALNGSGSDAFVSIAVKSDGRIAALGYRNALYQFNANGSLDTNFDADGSRSALNGISDSNMLLASASGRITVVGFPTLYAGTYPVNYRIARYLPNGAPDTGFSGDGFLDVDVTGQPFDGADAVAFDRQGRLFIAGRSWSGSGDYDWQYSTYSAARLLASPSQNVGFSGRVTETNGKAVINAYITLKLGSQTIGYARTNPFGYFRFANIPSAQTYTLSTVSKGLTFYDRSVLVDNATENFSIVGSHP